MRYAYLCPAVLIISMSTDDLREDRMTDVSLSQLAVFSQRQKFKVNGYSALKGELNFNRLRKGLLNCLNARSRGLNFRHRASCI